MKIDRPVRDANRKHRMTSTFLKWQEKRLSSRRESYFTFKIKKNKSLYDDDDGDEEKEI